MEIGDFKSYSCKNDDGINADVLTGVGVKVCALTLKSGSETANAKVDIKDKTNTANFLIYTISIFNI